MTTTPKLKYQTLHEKQKLKTYLIFSEPKPEISLSAAISRRSIILVSSSSACFSTMASSYFLFSSCSSSSRALTSLVTFSRSRVACGCVQKVRLHIHILSSSTEEYCSINNFKDQYFSNIYLFCFYFSFLFYLTMSEYTKEF